MRIYGLSACRLLVRLVANQQPVGNPLTRLRWVLWGAALLIGVAAGVAIFAFRPSSQPAVSSGGMALTGAPDVSWPAGTHVAPGFTLTDQAGKPVSLAGLRGRPVILTFIDPLCRNLCPLEARVLDKVVSSFPAASRPAIIAVSTNVYANARKNLILDEQKWTLPPQWRWGVGADAQLASVWKDYQVQVLVSTKTLAGVTIHTIVHTEAAYLIDPSGHQRALYLYPFTAQDVERTIRAITPS